MKRILFVLLLVFSVQVRAADQQDVVLNFDRISVIELVNLVYGEILRINFALDPEIVQRNETVTVHFQSKMDNAKVSDFLESLLKNIGVEVQRKKGYYYLKKTGPEEPETEILFYRPKFRSVKYISSLVNPLFRGQAQPQPFVGGALSGQPHIGQQQGGLGGQQQYQQGLGMGQQQQQANYGNPAMLGMQNQNNLDLDAFVFKGSRTDVEKIQKLLVQIDVPTGEVLVKGLVYEVSKKQGEGTALGLAVNLLAGKFGFGLQGGNFKNLGQSATFKLDTALGIDAIYSALSTDSRFKSVSHPSVRVQSGETAKFVAGAEVPVLGAAVLDKNANTVQSVEYKPSGVIFTVKPAIRESVIDLDVTQQLSSFTQTTTGVNNSPTLLKREVSSRIGAQSDEFIVLGGLEEQKTQTEINGLPFLPRWLRSNVEDESKTEILLFLQVQKL